MFLYVDITKKLNNFTLRVKFEAQKEIFALLGASGCGKSMTLKCIAGIENPDSGQIILNGRILYDSQKKICLSPQQRKVGYMFQDYALFPNVTVEKNIRFGINNKNINKKNIEEIVKNIIKKFHLEGLENQYPNNLSGGQKQRVAMARMLVSEPEIILMDEPFSALDSYLKWNMIDEMENELKKLNKIVLFVSHDRDEVYRLSDTIAAMDKGIIQVIDSKKEFFNNPKTITAAVVSGCKNIVKAERLDMHHIRIPEWDKIFFVKEEVKYNISAIGIRAHDFISEHNIKGDKSNLNIINILSDECRVQEEPFEWSIYFKCNKNMSETIQWKINKSEFVKEKMPNILYVAPEKILCLTDN